MRIQDLNPFDKISAKGRELVVLASVCENSAYLENYIPDIYSVFYIDLGKIYLESTHVYNIRLTKDSEMIEWEKIGNAQDDFECEIYTVGSKDKICKTLDKEFSKKDWNRFFLKLSGKLNSIQCVFEPHGRFNSETVSDSVWKYVEENVGRYEAIVGFRFGYYKINGELKKVVKFRDRVYFIKRNGSLGSFLCLCDSKFERKLKKTFHFSTGHARIWLKLIEEIYINTHETSP